MFFSRCSIRLAPVSPSGESVSRIQVEMYCEQMLFSTGGSAVTTTTVQPGTRSSTQISLPTNVGQLGFPATGFQIQPAPKAGAVPTPRLPTQVGMGTATRSLNQVAAGSTTPSQGPRNLRPLQQQPATPPRPSTLRFRNLSSTSEIT